MTQSTVNERLGESLKMLATGGVFLLVGLVLAVVCAYAGVPAGVALFGFLAALGAVFIVVGLYVHKPLETVPVAAPSRGHDY